MSFLSQSVVIDSRRRKPTVHLNVGNVSLSKKAFLIGLCLILLQVADGLLTYTGLQLFGLHMEGNALLRHLMQASGCVATVLVLTKLAAIAMVTWLTFQAHSRRWLRPVMGFLCGLFLALAVVPWSVLILSA